MTPLIIIGGGTAGLAAAVTAAESGSTVTLVEKTNRLGGMLHWSSGHFSGAGTRLQSARGIDDHPDFHFREVMEIGHGMAETGLVRTAVDQAPMMVDWLEDLGFPYPAETPALVTGHELYSRPRTYWGGDDPARGGLPIMEILLARLDRERVDVRVEARARRILVTGDPGAMRVVGIEIEMSGRTERLEAEHVILATGGYAADRELVQEMQPGYGEALIGCMDHATGDGHRMLRQLGVDLTHGDTYAPTMGLIEDPERPGYGLRLTTARVIVDVHRRQPWEVWVNRQGQRFVAEDTSSPFQREQALREQPGLEMFVIWDQNVVERATPPIGPDWTWPALLEEARSGRWLHMAEDLTGLCASLRIPADVVREELAGWSRPDRFGRLHWPVPIERGPFYGVRIVGGMLLSRGGPAVDDRLRPLDATGAPIAGLYAVGELLGMGKFSGDSFAGGMSVGPALALGRWLVREVLPTLSKA